MVWIFGGLKIWTDQTFHCTLYLQRFVEAINLCAPLWCFLQVLESILFFPSTKTWTRDTYRMKNRCIHAPWNDKDRKYKPVCINMSEEEFILTFQNATWRGTSNHRALILSHPLIMMLVGRWKMRREADECVWSVLYSRADIWVHLNKLNFDYHLPPFIVFFCLSAG